MSNTYNFSGALLSSNVIITGNLIVDEMISSTEIIQKNETSGFNTSLIIGDNTSINTQSTKGIHIGYDNSSNKGSIYVMNGESTLTDIYINDPSYDASSNTVIHLPSLKTKSISTDISNGNLTLTANGTGKLILNSDVELSGNLLLPPTTTSAGRIIQNGSVIFQRYGTNTIFLGTSSGNYSLTGTSMYGIGNGTLSSVTSGSNLIAIGTNSMGLGSVSGSFNIGIGDSTLRIISSGQHNIAIGNSAMYNSTSSQANIAIGSNSLSQLMTGSGNVCIGVGAGANFTSSESNNILIGSQSGLQGESNVIKIGNSSNKCYIEGIYNSSLGSTAKIVGVNDNNQLFTGATTMSTSAVINTNSYFSINGTQLLSSSSLTLNNGTKTATLNNSGANTADCTYSFPDKAAGTYTLATTADINSSSGGLLDLPANTKILYVSLNGNNTTGNGTFSNPYSLPSVAMASITGSSITNRYVIYCSAGVYGSSATTILFKPYVYICCANPFSCRIQENLSIDSSMLVGNVRSGAFGVLFSGSSFATFDFTTDSTHSHVIEFSNCQFNVPITYKSAGVADFFSSYLCNFFQAITISGGQTSMISCLVQTSLTSNTAFNGSAVSTFQGTQFNNGNVNVSSTLGLTNVVNFINSVITSPNTLTLSNVTPGNTSYIYDSASRIPLARLSYDTSVVLTSLSQPNSTIIGGRPVLMSGSGNVYSFRYSGKYNNPFTKAYLTCGNSGGISSFELTDLLNSTILGTVVVGSGDPGTYEITNLTNIPSESTILQLNLNNFGGVVEVFSLTLE